MSLFRIFKYSSLLFFFSKYRGKIFRIVAVILFAAVTSLLYQDVAGFLERQYPGTVIYALVAKIFIVYGALAFVLWQFRPAAAGDDKPAAPGPGEKAPAPDPNDRLSALEDVETHDRLRSRYDRLLEGGGKPPAKE